MTKTQRIEKMETIKDNDEKMQKWNVIHTIEANLKNAKSMLRESKKSSIHNEDSIQHYQNRVAQYTSELKAAWNF